MSLSTRTASDGMDPLSQAVNSAAMAGILPVVAAGNAGPDAATVGAPAAAEKATSVCSLRDAGEAGWSLAPFSSRGPTLSGRIKPDICAPGVAIVAPEVGTADRYVAMNGTSMAAPFVSGVAALMFSANPYLSVQEVQEMLYDTAQDWGVPGKDIDYGYGRINAYRAVQQVMRLPGMGPTGPRHSGARGLVEDGAERWYTVVVTDPSQPLAATLLMSGQAGDYYDLDLYLFDEQGNELAASADIFRQETINLQPLARGKYYLLVHAYEGTGPFALDVSWR